MKETMIEFQILESLANSGVLLAGLALKSTLLLLVVAVVVTVMRRSSAALRHSLWAVCCLGLLILPVFSLVLPPWQPTWVQPFASSSEPIITKALITSGQPVLLGSAPEMISPELPSYADVRIEPEPSLSNEQWLFAALFVIWLLGVGIVARKQVLGFVAAKRLGDQGYPVEEGELWEEFTQCASSLSFRSSSPKLLPRLVLVDDDELPIPLTWGFGRSVVLMPESALHWPASCRRAALLHELSHIRRFDWLIQSLTSWSCLLYWFHPLAWFAYGRLRLESERATDDHVLTTGLKATDYSSSLLEIVRFVASPQRGGAHPKDSLMKFAVPLSNTSKIEVRLRSILDPKQSRSAVSKRFLSGITLIASVAIVPLAMAKQPTETQVPGNVQEPNKVTKPVKAQDLPRSNQTTFGFDREWVYTDKPVNEKQKYSVSLVSRKNITYLRRELGLKPTQGPLVKGFKFSGNTALTTSHLQKTLVSNVGDPLNQKIVMADVEAIEKAYRNESLFVLVQNVSQEDDGTLAYALLEAKITQVNLSAFDKAGFESSRKLIGTTANQPYNEIRVQEDLARLIGTHLFESVTASVKDDTAVAGGVTITFQFKEKANKPGTTNENLDQVGGTIQFQPLPQTRAELPEKRVVTGFKFTGNAGVTAEELQQVLISKVGVDMNSQDINRDVEAIGTAYRAKGLAVLVEGATQEKTGEILYSLLEAKITQIKLSGLTKTDPQSVRKLITTPVDGLFDASKLNRDVSRLWRTDLFIDATYQVNDDPNVQAGVIVIFEFKEKGAP